MNWYEPCLPTRLLYSRFGSAIQKVLKENPEATESFEICLAYEGGFTKTESLVIPKIVVNENFQDATDYIAATINNLAMTLGGVAIDCRCSNLDLVSSVLKVVENRYPQVKQVLSDFYNVSFSISHKPKLIISEHPFIQDRILSVVPANFTEESGITIGINIGQTMTKTVALRNGKEIPATRTILPTWGDNGQKTYKGLYATVDTILRNIIDNHDYWDNVDAIGISIGGIVRDGLITSRSGIAAHMSDDDFVELRKLGELLHERFDMLTLISQDVVAKAHTIHPHFPDQKLLVLDLGTSAGGCYIEADGTIPGYLNQVGRVVIDLSQTAIPRDDDMGCGVLSKYLSLTGYEMLCLEFGFDNLSREDLISLLDRDDPTAEKLFKALSIILVETIIVLNKYYDAEKVILTGGLVQGVFGTRLLQESNRVIDKSEISIPTIDISKDPLFEGSIGAASMAAIRFHSLNLIPAQVGRMLKNAVAQKLSLIVAVDARKARRIVMDSSRGREHYVPYNEQFIRRFITHSTSDSVFRKGIEEKLFPEMRDYALVSKLTPQQVQTAAVSVVSSITGKADPFWLQKHRTNMHVLESVKSIASEPKSDIISATQPHFEERLKSLLVISGIFNALDFFNPEAIKQVLENATSLSECENLDQLLHHLVKLTNSKVTSLLAFDDFKNFFEQLQQHPGGSLIYFLDNAGEAVIDLLVAELLLNAGYKVTMVAGYAPFVDDITAVEIVQLISQFESLTKWKDLGRFKLSTIDSDLNNWGEVLLEEWPQAVCYIAKGMRKLSQIYSLNLIRPGLHVVLNKSDTVRRIIEMDRGISLSPEQNPRAILLFSEPI